MESSSSSSQSSLPSRSSAENWVVTSPYPGIYEITCLNEAVEFGLNRLTAPMSWDRAVEAVSDYEAGK